MGNTFKVKVNGEMEYHLDTADLNEIDSLETSKNAYHLLVSNRSYAARVLAYDFNKKQYEIRINNNRYSVSIYDSLDQLIDEMGFALGSSKDIRSIEAPMPGLILDISVHVGQAVKEDDPLLILEAMKMENIITSPREGVIKSIQVSKGDAVDKDNLLIEFE